ncbi:MAG: beta-ketoacyl-ACP synthase II [Chloroflexota bacterium]|nr:beta-ketoacyl-ACP synthase II [Chloroflexota bacterium]MDE2942003.1 beta-ketoacyl-ACP synthase II [Chloroflexota bacterium]MDE3267101.1 beta-ketoacyl-ACP synthase II [Chloroflexota bacterium]
MNTDRVRVVVTGMGAVTPLGSSVEQFWDGLVAGRSGIGPITLCDTTNYPTRIAGEIPDFEPDKYINSRESRRMARFSQVSLAAAYMAMEDASLDLEREDSERIGVLLGNGAGGLSTTQDACEAMNEKGAMRINPFFIPMMLPNMAAANVARLVGAKGYNSTVVTACAASNQAIGEAAEAIRRGAVDVVLAGGSEASISEIGLSGFCILKALSTHNDEPERASRPFDANRDGFVPAEGAAILVLESLEHALERGAPILAEVAGYGASSDAFHAVQPDENGEGACRAMRWALENAGITTAEVDYINAHGTSTPLNDAVETMAIKSLFGERAYAVPISSTKSMIGHALGGAGALEAVACVKTILDGIIHPTVNQETPDPACDLDYVPNEARRQPVNVVLSNSFGFGGQNTCIVLRRFAG